MNEKKIRNATKEFNLDLNKLINNFLELNKEYIDMQTLFFIVNQNLIQHSLYSFKKMIDIYEDKKEIYYANMIINYITNLFTSFIDDNRLRSLTNKDKH
jgi:hypothetical protein